MKLRAGTFCVRISKCRRVCTCTYTYTIKYICVRTHMFIWTFMSTYMCVYLQIFQIHSTRRLTSVTCTLFAVLPRNLKQQVSRSRYFTILLLFHHRKMKIIKLCCIFSCRDFYWLRCTSAVPCCFVLGRRENLIVR